MRSRRERERLTMQSTMKMRKSMRKETTMVRKIGKRKKPKMMTEGGEEETRNEMRREAKSGVIDDCLMIR
jgi:hypothetical protein